MSTRIKQDFTPQELAAVGREIERKRELRLSLASSIGERVTASAEFKQLVRNLPASDNVPVLARRDRNIDLASLDATETKTLIRSGSSTSAGAHLTAEPGLSAPVPARPLRVLDLVRQGEMSSDTISFARQSAYTPAATAAGEAVDTTTGTKLDGLRDVPTVSAHLASILRAP
jgi:hypothetical protein